MLPIHERFATWQGEGFHMGRSAFFIRTFGCPLHCPWCDSAGTWHKDFIPANIERMSAQVLVQEAVDSEANFVVVTGGEPAIHDLTELTELCANEDLPVHLETSGAYPIRGKFNWITLSPKRAAHPLLENIPIASELKLIVEDPKDPAYWVNTLVESMGTFIDNVKPIWLHPEWSKRKDPEVLRSITEWVKTYGDPFRVGYQLHKIYGADSLDKRTRPLVPLGGNPNLGY